MNKINELATQFACSEIPQKLNKAEKWFIKNIYLAGKRNWLINDGSCRFETLWLMHDLYKTKQLQS